MKKIYINTPYAQDANSFWRCMGPMSYLAKNSGGDIDIFLPPENSNVAWHRLSDFDLIFMHRPCRPDDLTILQIARNLNIPVWVDYDDWLFHLPDWNPNASAYHNAGLQHIMATMLACADVVSTSTQALAKEFSAINPNVVLIPNAYRSDLFPFRAKDMLDRKEIFSWRGTNTHEGDLLSVPNAFSLLSKKIHFMGSPPFSLTSTLQPDSYVKVPMTDALMYWKSIYQMAPKVLLFPLHDSFFNHCKSNIAWIEAIHAGALCVAPENMVEWNHPGIIGYKAHDSASFLNAAETAMAMTASQHKDLVADAYDYVRSKFDISIINLIRIEILKSIFSPSFERNKRDPYNQLTGMWALSILKKEPLPRLGDSSEKQSV